MAESEVLAELMNHRCGFLIFLVCELPFYDLCFEIFFVFEYLSIYATLLKYHLIKSESTSFVCENKFYLTHLFNEIGVSTNCETEFFIVNSNISPNDK